MKVQSPFHLLQTRRRLPQLTHPCRPRAVYASRHASVQRKEPKDESVAMIDLVCVSVKTWYMCVSDRFAFAAFFDLTDQTPLRSVAHAARHMANVKQHVWFLGWIQQAIECFLGLTPVSLCACCQFELSMCNVVLVSSSLSMNLKVVLGIFM